MRDLKGGGVGRSRGGVVRCHSTDLLPKHWLSSLLCVVSGISGHYPDASRGSHLEGNLDLRFAKLKVRHFCLESNFF